ncbi:GPW/gp25 family protein [Wohlfahrtiimonas larvae]|uniref:IraD/Gp25-like domain-containing protein n=1 Tax=Wohlfahrtiimonas larvae TaxID=1157986 RepID=A0ABP9MK02_9GAMM|nr:GPW/gp25 family protein [Wohlfahrtiimonas larvae]
MSYISRETGKPIALNEHIEQSIMDIITTRIGSRVMLRYYGTLLPEMVDKPGSDYTLMLLMASTTMALLTYEPRIILSRVLFIPSKLMRGKIEIYIDAVIKENQSQLNVFQYLTPTIGGNNV